MKQTLGQRDRQTEGKTDTRTDELTKEIESGHQSVIDIFTKQDGETDRRTDRRARVLLSMHYGSKQPIAATSNHSHFHELGSK